MSNYAKILQQFTKAGLRENSSLSEIDIKRALDQICQRNARLPQFSPEVAQELWSEVEKNQDDRVSLKDYINVITKAQSILKDNIQKCENELQSRDLDPDRRLELIESLSQFNDDLKLLSLPFQLSAPISSRISHEQRPREADESYRSSLGGSGLFAGRSSGIFAGVPSARENSTSLKLTFLLAIIIFIFELIITFHKNHFYNLLVYVAIFAIVLLGYFDKYYMRFIMVNLALSSGLDFLWIIVQASDYWNPNPPTHHSTIQTPFLRFMYIFVIILLCAKIFLGLLLVRYLNNDESVRKTVTVFGHTFAMDGKMSQNNPVSRILSGQGLLSSKLRQ